jgi:hypothetical protein
VASGDLGSRGKAGTCADALIDPIGSTGATAQTARTTASRNAWKGGTREVLRELARLLKAQRKTLKG